MLAVPAYCTTVPSSVQPWASVQGYYAPLGSPGDGWPPFLRPIPSFRVPTPAYHFLSVAEPEPSEEQLRLMRALKGPYYPPTDAAAIASASGISGHSTRSFWDQRETAKLRWVLRMPVEILDLILCFAVSNGDGAALAQASRTLQHLCIPKLYRAPLIRSAKALTKLSRTLESQPALAENVRELDLRARSVRWEDAQALALSLGRTASAGKLDRLAVRFQGSDLALALPFLQRLSPRRVEWSTSPCWYMRPEDLFTQLFSGWKDLTSLRLAGFAPDRIMSCVIGSAPSLRCVELCGAALARLDVDTLSDLVALNLRVRPLHPHASTAAAAAAAASWIASKRAEACAKDIDVDEKADSHTFPAQPTPARAPLERLRLEGVPAPTRLHLLSALPQLLSQLPNASLDALDSQAQWQSQSQSQSQSQCRYGAWTPPTSPACEYGPGIVGEASMRRDYEAMVRQRISEVVVWA